MDQQQGVSLARDFVQKQFVAKDIDEAALLAARAGNDMMMTTTAFYA